MKRVVWPLAQGVSQVQFLQEVGSGWGYIPAKPKWRSERECAPRQAGPKAAAPHPFPLPSLEFASSCALKNRILGKYVLGYGYGYGYGERCGKRGRRGAPDAQVRRSV